MRNIEEISRDLRLEQEADVGSENGKRRVGLYGRIPKKMGYLARAITAVANSDRALVRVDTRTR